MYKLYKSNMYRYVRDMYTYIQYTYIHGYLCTVHGIYGCLLRFWSLRENRTTSIPFCTCVTMSCPQFPVIYTHKHI